MSCPPADRRVGEPLMIIVYVDDRLARDHSVGKGHDPSVSFQAGIDHKAGCKSLVHRPDVTHCRPDRAGISLNHYLLEYGRHAFHLLACNHECSPATRHRYSLSGGGPRRLCWRCHLNPAPPRCRIRCLRVDEGDPPIAGFLEARTPGEAGGFYAVRAIVGAVWNT